MSSKQENSLQNLPSVQDGAQWAATTETIDRTSEKLDRLAEKMDALIKTVAKDNDAMQKDMAVLKKDVAGLNVKVTTFWESIPSPQTPRSGASFATLMV
ncbi:hypothetical protein E4U10_000784 [Claviceps purpurea]|nr:hypothetical protein E4U10_000784 [Claviceps purpurea]